MKKDDIMSGYEKIFEDGYKAGRASVVLPHPCDGELYKDWLLVEYIAKVLEESKEVVDAYIDLIKDPKNPERIKHLADECTDVQVAATGVMHKLGYGEEERQRVMKEINKSNAKRDGGKRFAKHPLDEIHERFYRGETFSASGAGVEQSDKETFKDGDKAKIIIPESEIRQKEKEGDVRKAQEMIITSNSIGRVVCYNTSLDTYALEVAGRIVGVPAEWLEKVEK